MLASFLLSNFFGSASSCDRYLMDSAIPGFGRGIYAGRNFQAEDTVEISPSLLVKNKFAMENQLQYFVYATDDAVYDAMIFGEGMMYNSLDKENIVHEWAEDALPGFDSLYEEPYTNYTSFKYIAEQGVRVGEEFFVNYGTEWFEQRAQKPISSADIVRRRYSLKDLEQFGFCLSDTYLSHSSIPMAGRGMFSKKAYKKGETVMISPVLLLPKHDVELTADSSVLMNYCISSNQSNVALLPISVGGMINHGGTTSNVEVIWGTDASTESHLSWSVTHLSTLNYAPLSINYVAKRPILIGEEITLSYGENWEKAWLEHLHALQVWNEKYSSSGHYMKPQFRHMLEAPLGMFPQNFYQECFGTHCQKISSADLREENKNKIAEALSYAQRNFEAERLEKECSATDACAT
jgi:hypothetical protein